MEMTQASVYNKKDERNTQSENKQEKLMKQRLVAGLLAACMLVPALAACGSSAPVDAPSASTVETQTEPPTTVETEPPKPTDGLPDKDMQGWEFHVLQSVTSGYCVNQPEELNGELINDALYERNAAAQDRFNFKLSSEDVTPATSNSACISALLSNATAGDNTYQLYLPYTKTLISYVDVILPWNDVPHLDWTNPWWFPDATQKFNIGGYQFALSGCFDLCIPSRTGCLSFNKELMTELNFKENVYDLVRAGKWTLDKFIEMGCAAISDLDGDGVIGEKDRIAFSGPWKSMNLYINGFGVNYAEKDAEGFPIFAATENEPLVNAIMTLKNMLATHPDMYVQKAGNNYSVDGQPLFASRGALFAAPAIHSWVGEYRDLSFEVGMLPPPKLNEEQGRYYCSTAYGHSPTLCRALPKSDYGNVGLICEAFAFSTYYDLLPIYKDVALKNKAAASPDESEMVDLIWSSISYDFGVLCWESILADPIVNHFFLGGSDDVASYLVTLQSGLRQSQETLHKEVAALKAAG